MTDQMINASFPMHVGIVVMNPSQLAGVYALLGGVAPGLLQALENAKAIAAAAGSEKAIRHAPKPATGDAQPGTDNSLGTDETLTPENPASAGTGETATTGASLSDGEIDAHGHPWSADLHASTKGKTKDGLWRMKVGVSRPDPKPGFPADNGASAAGTGTAPATPTPSATSQDAAAPGGAPAATSGAEEDDEFAAFRNAAAASDTTDAAAAASVPERTYTDADLGALCNQAAMKLGDPSPVKEIIAQFTPDGEVAHSRNIPADKRAEFVKAVETKAGVEFAG